MLAAAEPRLDTQVLAELYGSQDLPMKPHIIVALVLHKLLDQACPVPHLADGANALRSVRNTDLCFQQTAAWLTFSERLCRRGHTVISTPILLSR